MAKRDDTTAGPNLDTESVCETDLFVTEIQDKNAKDA